jgi:hypothetical protein
MVEVLHAPVDEHVGIGVKSAASFNVIVDALHYIHLIDLTDNASTHLAVTLQKSLDGDLSDLPTASATEHSKLAALVHVPRLATDVGFVHFNLTAQLSPGIRILGSESRTLKHEPCSLLGNSNGPMNLPGGDAVLAVHE